MKGGEVMSTIKYSTSTLMNTKENNIYYLSEQLNDRVEIEITNSREGDILLMLEELYELYKTETKDNLKGQYRIALERIEVRLTLEKKRLLSDYESVNSLRNEAELHYSQALQVLGYGDIHLLYLQGLMELLEQYIDSIYMTIERVTKAINDLLLLNMKKF